MTIVRSGSQQSVNALLCDDSTEPAIACPICQQGVLRIVHSWDRYSPAACQPPSVAAVRIPFRREDRLRYVAGTRWGTGKYLDMTRLAEERREKMIEHPAQQNGEFPLTQKQN